MENVNSVTKLKGRLNLSLQLIEQYSWLLDSYLLDYFTENHLDKLQKSWRSLFDSTSLYEFHKVLNYSQKIGNNNFPLSLICIKLLLQNLSLPREITGSNKFSTADNFKNNKLDLSKFDVPLDNKITSRFFTCPKLWNLFLKHVKPKKRYEIFKMAGIAVNIANRLKVEYLLDIGSGLGHLSRILAYGFNLNICSIETQSNLIIQAKKLDHELEETAKKYFGDSEKIKSKTKSPVHLNLTIKSDINLINFVENIKTAFSVENNDFKFGIVGLHPCGDLASILLKIYSNCAEAKFINLVGCCYHKLTTSCDIENSFGFPMSEYCQKKNACISYEARALSCHAIETYCERLKLRKYDHLKVHCYRAALEKIIHKNWPYYKKSALGNVKIGSNMDFFMYCKKAMEKLKVFLSEEDFYSQEILNDLSQWQDVAKFYSLRLMFAPLIETIILLDRKMYLLEKGVPCEIVAAFDPVISPRNQLLLSEKPF